MERSFRLRRACDTATLLFAGGKITIGKEKSAKWFASSQLFNRFIPDDEKGALGDYLHICQKLANAVERLHAAGFAHGDISYNNIFISPKDRDLCVLGADALIVPGAFPPKFLGAPDFIAPEIVMPSSLPVRFVRKLPSVETDRHALAVFIYTLLFHRHPLRGFALYSQDLDTQERLEMGERALFVEHPTDDSNRLDPNERASVLERYASHALHDPWQTACESLPPSVRRRFALPVATPERGSMGLRARPNVKDAYPLRQPDLRYEGIRRNCEEFDVLPILPRGRSNRFALTPNDKKNATRVLDGVAFQAASFKFISRRRSTRRASSRPKR